MKSKKQIFKRKLLISIVWTVFMISFTVGFLTDKYMAEYRFKALTDQTSYSSIESNCYDLDLRQTSLCLGGELSKWYKYNISNVGKRLTEYQLVNEGGVCIHYSDWYKKELELRGYPTQVKSFIINDTNTHVVAVSANEEGYCVLDQLNIGCVDFVQDSTRGDNE